MLKKMLFAVLALLAATAFAAVDVNKADQAQLETVKGVGATLSARIIAERKTGPYKDWNDFIARVAGVGKGSASRLSKEGLTVNGSPYAEGDAKTDTKAEAKPAEKNAKPAAQKATKQP
ncbi:helix-hairpin-helix domain-containing protein [Aquabacterium sp. A7-Y]|uniref:ComEA family DNA-binding protein n=1 Tax=Aquabacterium sp. A7-Y TaxID=1349605 RepID=UPI00223D76E5|nr:helix-hairpin-helix domain-containing protein [Aquabacterium sp. A7-Y]MCW7536489.1 helix-hairpin-helix domain-containing protein [Aquabacterium sp. A7-Y]